MLPPLPVSASVPSRAITRVALAALLAAGCRDAAPPDAAAPPPPAAEFVLAAGDSAFWVTSVGGTVRVRGAPLELARVDGRFYELYVADDDRSFEDATFIGQRVYRRDLLRGDSVLVYEDSLVPRLAREYARAHPEDHPLAENDEASDDPLWSGIATLDLVDVHGPFVSFDAHTDVVQEDAPQWHTSRRGVIDLRRGGTATLAAVVGDGAALLDVERRRAETVRAAIDSARTSTSGEARRAAAALPAYRLDAGNFALTTVDGGPAVAYALSGAGGGDAGHLLSLPPIRIGEPAWWPDVAASLPVGSVGGTRDVWRHQGYEVVVHYDSIADAGRLTLRDSTSREWTIARVPGPATRIFWLDRPAIDSASRHALVRAFDESSLYDEAVRTASLAPRGHGGSRAALAAIRRGGPPRQQIRGFRPPRIIIPTRTVSAHPRTPARHRAPHA